MRVASIGVRTATALLALIAIVVQLVDLARRGVLNPVNYVSYFTIQSNLIGASALMAGASMALRHRTNARLERLRGASVVYLTTTFVVFALLLSGTDVDTAIPWVDTVLHKIVPIVVAADWIIDPPATHISIVRSLQWLIYPLIWLAYTVLRGRATGWYPYPFLNPANGGMARVTSTIAAIVAFGAILCAIVAASGRPRGTHRPAPSS
ncbi:MAG TPA: Pr6Pr family membrane protein [Vicinamibacterales bacterium]|jgi:hypothetical protein|nr:Pr6Pr family membrane protein [Vicinamibacterales bacterium]